MTFQILKSSVVLDTTKVQIFKQITTNGVMPAPTFGLFQIPQRYRFSSKSQLLLIICIKILVVLDTTKVQIFKQITTTNKNLKKQNELFQIPQRYRFSSKSQLQYKQSFKMYVVLDTTKVQIFKQITTCFQHHTVTLTLFQIPQRYRFSSKSQLNSIWVIHRRVVLDTTKVQIFKQITTDFDYSRFDLCCFRYHKGTDFQANHNPYSCSCLP